MKKRHIGQARGAVELSLADLDKVSGGDTKSGRWTTSSDESPKEEVTFEYGALQISYA